MRVSIEQIKALQAATPKQRRDPSKDRSKKSIDSSRRRDEEHALQSMCVQWWYSHPATRRHQFIAIPNQAERTAAQHVRMRKEGFRKGAFDTFFVTPVLTICYVEFKSPRGTLSDDQEDFANWCDQLGIPQAVCRTFPEFEDFVGQFFKLKA